MKKQDMPSLVHYVVLRCKDSMKTQMKLLQSKKTKTISHSISKHKILGINDFPIGRIIVMYKCIIIIIKKILNVNNQITNIHTWTKQNKISDQNTFNIFFVN